MPKVSLFGASWCGPCKAAREMIASMGGSFEYIDVDAKPDEGVAAAIQAVPTVVVTHEDGMELGRMAGGVSRSGLAELFRAVGV